MVATGHISAAAKMNTSYLPGGANVHSFHHLSEKISLHCTSGTGVLYSQKY